MKPKQQSVTRLPLIGARQVALLEKLSNACAVSGDEGEVRRIVQDELKSVADEMKHDALGNLLVIRKARTESFLKVMIAAHMDEVGFMIVDKEEGGLFRFEMVGGVSKSHLAGKAVWVGTKHHYGVIGAKAIHLISPEELKSPISLENLRIDMGPGGSDHARVGDRATFATTFRRVGPSLIGKALDNRLGVATLIELVKHAPMHIELQAAFTVQEEIGARGASVAAYALQPDLAIALDSTPAYDLPDWDGQENTRYNTRLGFGPAIYVADAGTISDPRLISFLVATAEQYRIPYQIRQPGGGGTDAGAIHRSRAGVPSVSVSIPGRYAHTPAGLCRISDWRHTLALLYHALQDITPSILETERRMP